MDLLEREVSILKVDEAKKERGDSYAKFDPEWGSHPVPPLPDIPIFKLVSDSAKKWPDKDALICMGRKLSYKELDELSDKLAFALANKFGIKKGDRVAGMLPNCIQHTLLFLAVDKLGAIYSPVNVMYKPRELEYQLSDCGARVFVTLDKLYPIMDEIQGKTPVENIVLTNIADFATLEDEIPTSFKAEKKEMPGTYQLLSLLEEPAGKLPRVEINPEDLAFLWYTAGTTGVSKGVMITHKNFITATHSTDYVLDFNEQDVNLQIMPMFHCAGYLLGQFPLLYCGGAVVLLPFFNAKKCLEWIEGYGVSVIFAPPTFYLALMSEPNFKDYNLSTLRKYHSSNGAPQPAALRDRWNAMTGLTLLQGYGLTETTCQGAATINTPKKYKGGSIGPPFNCEMKIVDENNQTVPRGTVGEIMFRGDGVAKGYWRKPDETKATFQSDGWLHTGDAGYMDSEDFIFFVDRYKDLIVASGYNIAPFEVEGILMQHPAVKEAGVVGIPDEYRGETVKAFVSLNKGYENITPDELIEHCKRNLATFKAPRAIQFIDEIPKNPVGKIMRRTLRELSSD